MSKPNAFCRGHKYAPWHMAWIIAMLLMLCSQTAMAWDTPVYQSEGSWTGKWDDKEACGLTQPAEVDGCFLIYKPEELGYVAWALNKDNETIKQKFLNATIKLMADLDMGAHHWERVTIGNYFGGTFDGNGHTISNLYIVNMPNPKANHGGALFSSARGATFKNLTFYKCYSEGQSYSAFLVACSDGNITIDNVHLVKCKMNTHGFIYSAGFVACCTGESKDIKITNCSSDVRMDEPGTGTGGFIGAIESKNAVAKFSNCVVRTDGNNYFKSGTIHGGYVGFAAGSSYNNLNHCAVYSRGDEGLLDKSKKASGIMNAHGAFYGGWHPDEKATFEGDMLVTSDIENWSSLYKWQYCVGYSENSSYDSGAATINPCINNIDKDKNALVLANTLNEKGMQLGVHQYDGEYYTQPLTDSIGRMVEYKLFANTYASIDSCYTDDLSNALLSTSLTNDMRAYLSCGKSAYYKVAVNNDKYWTMTDLTTNIGSKERVNKNWFRGMPSTQTGTFNFYVTPKPVSVWRTCTYSKTRQVSRLEWSLQYDVDIEAWKNAGAKFFIFRNGEKIDSVAFGSGKDYSWEDKNPVTGEMNKYEVKVLCPEVFYGEEDNISVLAYNMSCSGIGKTTTSVSGNVGKLQLAVYVPNSKAYNGCKVSIVKHMLAAGDTLQAQNPQFTPLDTKTFSYDSENTDSIVKMVFTDTEATAPCSKWVYETVCYDFADDSEAKGNTVWGNTVEVLAVSDFKISSFTASKGENTDKINLTWNVSKGTTLGNVMYVLSRKMYERGQSDMSAIDDSTGWKEVYTVTNSNTANYYSDTALPGYVYKYQLKAHPSCDNSYAKNIYTTANTIGYAASRGTIMGSITYEGNTAVQGVDVRLTPEDGSFSQKGGSYVVYFDGKDSALPLATGMGETFWKGDWTLSFMYQPVEQDEQATILTLPGRFALTTQGDKLYLGGNESMVLPRPRTYNHIMLSHNKAQAKTSIGYALGNDSNDSVAYWTATYDDATLINALGSNAALTNFNDTLMFGGGFEGYIDEVRLWETSLTDQQVADTYNRYLSGSEQNLAAYYTFDSGVEEYAFDTSHPGGHWNNLHTTLPSVGHPLVTDACLVPDEILSYRGVTDKNGEYQISGVPFTGEGSNYQVVPIYGTHNFSPASTRRYVSQQSLNHSDVNFTDKSSFTVPVRAYYAYGTLPAEGLYVMVDGVSQNDDNNELIATDKNGYAVVNVPIGRHRVSLSATNHTMVNNGYACSVEVSSENGALKVTPLSQDKGYLDFQANLTAPMTFYDSTLVRVAGRVAGGKDEAAKPVNFNQGHANLGTYNITFVPNVSGLVNNSDKYSSISIAPDTIVNINSKTTYSKASVNVETDATTGEYIAMLPPLKWTVKNVASKNGGVADIDLESLGNIITGDINKELADTLWYDSNATHNPTDKSSYETFKYNVRKDYIKYNAPKLTVTNITPGVDEADSLMLGSKYIPVQYIDSDVNETVKNDTLYMWRKGVAHDGSAASYALGCPVLEAGQSYKLRFSLMESYKNHDNEKVEIVPVRNANININNKWASSVANVLSTGDYQIADTLNNDTVSTKAGIAEYEFTAGYPNTFGDYKLPLNVTYEWNNQLYEGVIMQGYVVGGIANSEGNNYIATIEGPKDVLTVVCDPPGSGSSAYIDKGTVMSSKLSVGGENSEVAKTSYSTTIGDAEQVWSIGSLVGQATLIKENETTSTNVVTISTTNSYNHQWENTYTLNEKYQTGTDRYHVGAMGDLYIGNSINYVFGKSKNLFFVDSNESASGIVVDSEKGRKFRLNYYSGVGKKREIASSFYYSQYQIVNVVIPDLEKQRNALVSESHYVEVLPTSGQNEINKYTYYVLKSSRDKEYWERNVDYVSFAPQEMSDGEVARDSVLMYNEWIRGWQSAIEETERKKVEMFKTRETKHYRGSSTDTTTDVEYGFIRNLSFDGGGANITGSFKTNESSLGTVNNKVAYAYECTYKVKGDLMITTVVGSEMLNTATSNITTSRTGSDSKSESDGVGYTLADSDIGDNFSVDVYMPGELTSASTALLNFGRQKFVAQPFMFRTQAGQSREPWEKTQYTLYYKENGKSVALDGGTENMAIPSIKFSQHELTQVPSGTTPTVKMTIANNSTCTTGYKIISFSLISLVNHEGLIVLLDGEPISDGMSVVLAPGVSDVRTIAFRQSRPDALDFDNIVFRLMNGEQKAYDTISVHFQPAAPPVKIASNNGSVVNAESNSQKLLFTLNGYDTSYDKFTGIRLQYRRQGSGDKWATASTLLNDSAYYYKVYNRWPDTPWRQLTAASDTLSFDMTDLADGKYEVQAETFSIVGAGEITEHSEVFTVTKDTRAPEMEGVPKPSGSIYTPNDEISITFTEPIDVSNINDANFYVTAALNDAETVHNSGLHFDGNTPATTSSRVNLLGAQRGLGLWYKPVTGKRSCLLSQTFTDANGYTTPFKIWYNEDASMSIEVCDTVYRSSRKALNDEGEPITDWMYAILVNDNETSTMRLFNGFGTSSAAQSDFLKIDISSRRSFSDTQANVPLYLGGSAYGDECHANMDGLIIYDSQSTLETIYADKDNKHTANLRGIEAYWPMDEGYGNTVVDKVRSRNLTLTGTDNWFVANDNYALRLNGTDQYAVLNTERSGIGKNEDFVLEMLFRTAKEKAGKHMTIFSNGWGGEGTTEDSTDVADRLSLALTEKGAIEFNAAGKTYIMGSGYDDNQWHHLALNVHRDAYTTVSVDTIDISNNVLIAGTDHGAFSNSRMTLGARRYRPASADAFTTEDFFEGDIDEVRVWSAYRTKSSVYTNVNRCLDGNEPGLVAYYPFERTDIVANQKKTTATIEDRVTNTLYHDGLPTMYGFAAAADSAALAQLVTTNQGPSLKPSSVQSPIAVTFTTSDSEPEKIVLNFANTVSRSSLQGCTINFTVDNLRDMAGNFMKQPVSWNCYADMRDVRWEDVVNNQVSMAHEIGDNDASETVLCIFNSSVKTANWKLSNIPSWLEVSKNEGVITAQNYEYITVKSKTSTAIGKYSGMLYLSSDEGVDDKLEVSLTVTGVRPDWTPADIDTDEWMSVVGRVKIANQWCNDEQSLVAAFDKDGVCHGVASPQYNKTKDIYYINMNILGGMPENNPYLYFKVWDSQTGLTYTHVYLSDENIDRTDSLKFVNLDIVGSFADYCLVEAADDMQQTISLKAGWNWVSNWIQPESNNINEVFALNKGVVTAIKRRFDNGVNYELSPAESYHLYCKGEGKLVLEGTQINPENVEIELKGAATSKTHVNWSWIGYPVSVTLTLEEAFADFRPQEGDAIKSQSGFAMFDGKEWVGSLKYLSPGVGYLYGYRGADDITWHYPYKNVVTSPSTLKTVRAAEAKANLIERERFACNHNAYSGNMITLGSLLVDGHMAEGWQVGAFVDGVCRGYETVDSVGRVYLTVSGNGTGLVTYRACNPATGAVMAIEQQHHYTDNAIVGNTAAPYQLSASTASHFSFDTDLPYAYEDYTYVTATVLNAEGNNYDHDYELAAFCGDECRGVAVAKAGNTCPIAIYGTTHDVYTFKLWDKTTMQEIDLEGTKEYDAETPVQTITLRVPNPSGINDVEADDANQRWYDVSGYRYGKKPTKRGVYIKDHQQVTVSK